MEILEIIEELESINKDKGGRIGKTISKISIWDRTYFRLKLITKFTGETQVELLDRLIHQEMDRMIRVLKK